MSLNAARFQCHVSVLLMSATAPLAMLSQFSPWRTTAYRVICGGVILLLFALWRKRAAFPRKNLVKLLLLGLVLGFHWFAFFHAITLLGVALACALYGTIPIFVAVGGKLFFGHAIHRGHIVSMVLILAGAALLMYHGDAARPDLGRGVLWIVIADVTFALLILANGVQVRTVSPLWVTTLELLGAIPLAVWMNREPLIPADGEEAVYALLLGLVCTGGAYVLYNMSIRILPAVEAGLILVLETVYGLIGGLLIGERLDAVQWIAVALFAHILVKDAWLYWRKPPQKSTATLA